MTNKLAAFMYVTGLVAEDQDLSAIITHSDQLEQCLRKLIQDLHTVTDEWQEAEIQAVFYEAGKQHFAHCLRWWFQALYQILLQKDDGPRLGQFTRMMSPHWVQQKLEAVMEDHWLVKVPAPQHCTVRN